MDGVRVYATRLREGETKADLLTRFERGVKDIAPDENVVVSVIGLDETDVTEFYKIVERCDAELAAWTDFEMDDGFLYCGWIGWNQVKLLGAINAIARSLGQTCAEVVELGDQKRTIN